MKKRIAAGVLALSMMMGTASFAANHGHTWRYSGTSTDTEYKYVWSESGDAKIRYARDIVETYYGCSCGAFDISTSRGSWYLD